MPADNGTADRLDTAMASYRSPGLVGEVGVWDNGSTQGSIGMVCLLIRSLRRAPERPMPEEVTRCLQ
jgi:hypothetical protein